MLHVDPPHRHHILLAPFFTVPPGLFARDMRPGVIPAFVRLLFVLPLVDPAVRKSFAVRCSRAGDRGPVDSFGVFEAVGAVVA